MAGTAFQRKVWDALLTIPFGETQCVPADRGTNRQPHSGARSRRGQRQKSGVDCLVPCHRVIGSNGSLTGFAGGLDVKSRLLTLEGADQSGPAPA